MVTRNEGLDYTTGNGYSALDAKAARDARDGYSVVSGLEVSTDGTNLTLDVSAGSATVGATSGSVDTVSLASAGTVTLAAADSQNPRKDTIYIDTTGTLQAETGVAEPADPTGNTRFNTYQPEPPYPSTEGTILAEVWVAAGASSIASADVRDRRVPSEWVGGSVVAETVGADQLHTDSEYTYTIHTLGSDIVADGPTAPEVASGSDLGTVVNDIFNNHITSGEGILVVGSHTYSTGLDDTNAPGPYTLAGTGTNVPGSSNPDTASIRYTGTGSAYKRLRRGTLENLVIEGDGANTYGIQRTGNSGHTLFRNVHTYNHGSHGLYWDTGGIYDYFDGFYTGYNGGDGMHVVVPDTDVSGGFWNGVRGEITSYWNDQHGLVIDGATNNGDAFGNNLQVFLDANNQAAAGHEDLEIRGSTDGSQQPGPNKFTGYINSGVNLTNEAADNLIIATTDITASDVSTSSATNRVISGSGEWLDGAPTYSGTSAIYNTAPAFFDDYMANITAQSTVPSSPFQGMVYLDDGTNTGDGNPHFRYYDGTAWNDL